MDVLLMYLFLNAGPAPKALDALYCEPAHNRVSTEAIYIWRQDFNYARDAIYIAGRGQDSFWSLQTTVPKKNWKAVNQQIMVEGAKVEFLSESPIRAKLTLSEQKSPRVYDCFESELTLDELLEARQPPLKELDL